MAAAAITVATWKLAGGDGLPDPAPGGLAMPSLLGAGSDAAGPALGGPTGAQPGGEVQRPLAHVEAALFARGSLRGTDFPAWGTARGEPVKPNRTLRDRFDYYLLGLHEASVAELSAMLQAHAERDLGIDAARDIRAVWDRYLQLQQHAFTHVANPMDPGSMQTALQEHQQVRQSLLGVHWAQAFYGDEEKTLSDELRLAQAGMPTRSNPERVLFNPPAGHDPQALQQQRSERFGAEAAQRLRVLDEEDTRWSERLARARTDVQALRHNPAYSATQLEEAVSRYMASAFPDDGERLRASGLLAE